MQDWGLETVAALKKIREQSPLIHNLTNFVVMNSTANVILAVGASPVMAHAAEEVEEMASNASALVLNIGTLDTAWVESMLLAGKAANRAGIPVIFDPVGVGATRFRLEAALKILETVKCSIIRANAAEIFALAGKPAKIRGVDSIQGVEEVAGQILDISQKLNCVVAVTGVEDLVCDGTICLAVSGGDEMFRRVTGTGCAASATCACFAAVQSNFLESSVQALAYYGIAGMEAAYKAKGPGSFQVQLLDSLANVNENTIVTSMMVRGL